MTAHAVEVDGKELARRAREIMGEALRLGSDLLTSVASTRLTMPKLAAALRPSGACTCGCCEIPETECPPRCVCTLHLEAMTGQTVAARIRVVNESATARTFELSAAPFVCGGETATFALEPKSLTIAANGSALAIATLAIPGSFLKGRYQAEILVRGSYEQCVDIELDVGCGEILSGTCTVEQKEHRFRIRAHHWYDHFQCVEPCEDTHQRADTVGA